MTVEADECSMQEGHSRHRHDAQMHKSRNEHKAVATRGVWKIKHTPEILQKQLHKPTHWWWVRTP